MRLLLGQGLAAEIRSSLAPVAKRLAARDLAAAYPEITAVAGTPDPLLLARIDGPIVAVPADAPSRRAGSPLLARASALALPDSADRPEGATGLPAVVIGVPPPAPAETRAELDPGTGTRAIADALHVMDEHPPEATSAHGVTWILGGGSAPLARAMAAWASGRAALALPGTSESALLERANCPRAPGALEALELTLVLLASPPLVRALAARGRRAAPGAGTLEGAVGGLLEAAELARERARCGGPAARSASGFRR